MIRGGELMMVPVGMLLSVDFLSCGIRNSNLKKIDARRFRCAPCRMQMDEQESDGGGAGGKRVRAPLVAFAGDP